MTIGGQHIHSRAPTVLVADDGVLIRGLVETALLMRGFDVFTAASGDEASAVIDAGGLDLVILDIEMPGCPDGRELARRTADRLEPLPLVVMGENLSEFGPAGRAKRLRLLWKPYTVERLLRCIDSIDLGYTEYGTASPAKP